jgi:outer membrane protein OmpA-like peptidoglycan-associated protein
MVATASDGGADAKFVTAGLTVGWDLWTAAPAPLAAAPAPAPVPPPPPADRDHDGLADADDRCPGEPPGATPDPRRAGCPLRDADKDTVADEDDRCPAIAAGPSPDPDQPGCPDADDDQDGVLNHQDRCRAEAAGLNPDTTQPGCPMGDADHDSVPDLYDACRDKPGAPDADPKKNGCPGLVVIEPGAIKILRPVYFATNKDRILPKSVPVLKAVAAALTATPAIRKVGVQGHTDEQGSPALNQDLSARRAASVKRWLEENGVAAERLSSEGFGDTRPVAPNKSKQGRAANRRVELMIVDPPTPRLPTP